MSQTLPISSRGFADTSVIPVFAESIEVVMLSGISADIPVNIGLLGSYDVCDVLDVSDILSLKDVTSTIITLTEGWPKHKITRLLLPTDRHAT